MVHGFETTPLLNCIYGHYTCKKQLITVLRERERAPARKSMWEGVTETTLGNEAIDVILQYVNYNTHPYETSRPTSSPCSANKKYKYNNYLSNQTVLFNYYCYCRIINLTKSSTHLWSSCLLYRSYLSFLESGRQLMEYLTPDKVRHWAQEHGHPWPVGQALQNNRSNNARHTADS